MKFREIFDGLQSAYGQTVKTGEIRTRDGKHETKNNIIRAQPHDILYQKHLNGEEPALGIIPLNEDNKCKWGCVDIDQYDLDHKQIIEKTKDLPTQLFRSKSGGGHLFLFTHVWVPASLMRQKLKMIAAHIGHGGAEIYPKQDQRKSEKSVGNYLNLPYFGGDITTRYAFTEDAKSMELKEFYDVYDKIALSEEQLKDLVVASVKKGKEQKETNVDFEGIPPCLRTMLTNKIGTGHRNDGMFHLGVYLKKRFEKNWKTKMLLYNTNYFNPPMDDAEVDAVATSIEKEDYKYKCKQEPMHSHCDPMACSMVKFGVGDGDLPGIMPGSIEKYESDPPIYVVSIDGDQVECDDETLWNPDKFGMACMNQTQKIMDPIGKLLWRKQLKKLFQDIQEVPTPDSAKLDVQLKESFQIYVNFAKAKKIEEVRRGKVFTENGKTTFKFLEFYGWLTKNGWDTRRHPKIKTQKLFMDIYKGVEEQPKINSVTTRVIIIDEVQILKAAPSQNKKQKSNIEPGQDETN